MTIVELSDEYKELILDIRKFIKFERRKEPDEIVSGFIVNIEPNNEILTVKISKYIFIDHDSLLKVNGKIGKVINSYTDNNNVIIEINLKNVSSFSVADKVEIDIINVIIDRLDNTIKKIEENRLEDYNKIILDFIIGRGKTSITNLKLVELSDNLNKIQKTAIKNALEADYFHLIIGPPGTGKSHVILELIYYLIKQDKKILVTASMNNGINNILTRLDDSFDDNILRIGSDKELTSSISKYTLQKKREKYLEWLDILKIDETINLAYKKLKPLHEAKNNLNTEIMYLNNRINNLLKIVKINNLKIIKNENKLNKIIEIEYNPHTEIKQKIESLKNKSDENHSFGLELLKLKKMEANLPLADDYYKLESEINELKKWNLFKNPIIHFFKSKKNENYHKTLNKKEARYHGMRRAFNRYWTINDELENLYKSDPSQEALNIEYMILEQLNEYNIENKKLFQQKLIIEKNKLLTKAYKISIKNSKKNNTYLSLEIKSIKNEIKFKSNIQNKLMKEMENIRDTIEQKKDEKFYLINFIDNDILSKSNLIAATIISSAHPLLDKVVFDVTLMDEASQVASYESLIPLLKCKKFILVGDDKQLQPIEKSNFLKELNLSIFNRLKNKYPENYTFLDTQYRMNKIIADIASDLFYDGKLKTYEAIADQTIEYELDEETALIINPNTPLTFIDTINAEYYENGIEGGCENRFEALLVTQIIKSLLNNNVNPSEIGVITPYKKHKKIIIKYLENNEVEVNTVDGFQGREKDIIIMSFCRSKIGRLGKFKKRFIEEPTRLNVSITRARKKLVIIGNSTTLKQSTKIKDIIQNIGEENTIKYDN
jgi:superfamily I DNA and/or RNA helicase